MHEEEFKLIKKPVGLLLTAFLTMGLAACNNNTKNNLNDRTDRVGMSVMAGMMGLTTMDHLLKIIQIVITMTVTM